MNKLIEKALATSMLDKNGLIELLEDDSINNELYSAADNIREKFVGNEVHLRGLIEFSNICSKTCEYCGLRAPNFNCERYALSAEQILDFAQKALSYGYKTVVLQSGESNHYSTKEICSILQAVKKLGLAITLSIGEKSFEEYESFKKAGADRYLLRIETTDSALYKKLHPNMSFENRVRCLKDLNKLGYEVGSGCLVGLPNQTIESLADDILFFKEINADMIGIGPFIPNSQTPLSQANGGDFELALKVMALTRLLLPDINIPATTAMETINKNGRVIALQSGANVVMPNVTEGDYRRKYEIYPGKICVGDAPSTCKNCITSKIESIGRTISTAKGVSKHFFTKG